MKISTRRIAVFLAALLMIGSTAWADLSNVSVTGTVWRVDGNMVNAPTSDPSGILEGTFKASSINFFVAGPQDSSGKLGDFLAYGSADVGGITPSFLSEVMSNCPNCAADDSSSYSTIIRIDGNATFVAGRTYTLTHDDGAVMYAGGNLVIDSPAPTSPLGSTWTPLSDVSGAFTIYYSATNGNPEQLRLDGQVPDGGATLMLLGCALFGVETLRRKLRA